MTSSSEKPQSLRYNFEKSQVQKLTVSEIEYYGEAYFDSSSRSSKVESGRSRSVSAHEEPSPINKLVKAIESSARKKQSPLRIGLELDTILSSFYAKLKKFIGRQAALVDAGPLLRRLRMIKDDDEVLRLKQSIAINEEALQSVVDRITLDVNVLDALESVVTK